jgi:hypothetical protein
VGERKVSCRVLWGNLKKRLYLEDLDIDESIILKLILSMSVGRRSGSGKGQYLTFVNMVLWKMGRIS